jgi:hypothetical protein
MGAGYFCTVHINVEVQENSWNRETEIVVAIIPKKVQRRRRGGIRRYN